MIPIKDILYQELEKITEKKIESFVINKKSSKLIDEVLSKTYPKLLDENKNLDENVGILAESLMHYLLTLAQIPSQRKIIYNNIEIDMVLPSIKILKSDPKNALIISFPKTGKGDKIKQKINDLEKIQPERENIWVVLHESNNIKQRAYLVNPEGGFSKIIDDIEEFFSTKKQSKLKILK